jgi:selenocysteine lyase/cysteine desulfurase
MEEGAMLAIDRIRQEFPIVEHAVYLNHAAVGPIPRRAHQAMVEHLDDYLANVLLHNDQWQARYQEVRAQAARLIGARPDQIAFVKNTSEGLSFAANGIDWRPGDNVIVPAADFPTVVYPWLNLAGRGVETRRIAARDGRVPLDDIRAAVDARTRAIVTSTVQFSSGFRADLAAIGDICRAHDLLFVVDGIQSLGALTLDVACGIDVLAADAHKWLLGPQGIGLFYVSDRALERLRVAEVGWLSVREPFEFRPEIDLLPDARRFEPGSPNSVGIFGLGGTLDLLLEIGIEAIEGRILSLTDLLCDGLQRKGYRIRSPRQGAERSGIVIVDSPREPTPALFERLTAERVLVSMRGGGLRVSPHAYNTEGEIEQLVEVLPG